MSSSVSGVRLAHSSLLFWLSVRSREERRGYTDLIQACSANSEKNVKTLFLTQDCFHVKPIMTRGNFIPGKIIIEKNNQNNKQT